MAKTPKKVLVHDRDELRLPDDEENPRQRAQTKDAKRAQIRESLRSMKTIKVVEGDEEDEEDQGSGQDDLFSHVEDEEEPVEMQVESESDPEPESKPEPAEIETKSEEKDVTEPEPEPAVRELPAWVQSLQETFDSEVLHMLSEVPERMIRVVADDAVKVTWQIPGAGKITSEYDVVDYHERAEEEWWDMILLQWHPGRNVFEPEPGKPLQLELHGGNGDETETYEVIALPLENHCPGIDVGSFGYMTTFLSVRESDKPRQSSSKAQGTGFIS